MEETKFDWAEFCEWQRHEPSIPNPTIAKDGVPFMERDSLRKRSGLDEKFKLRTGLRKTRMPSYNGAFDPDEVQESPAFIASQMRRVKK